MRTYRRKEWLLENGHITEKQAGRGRISYANKVLLQEAKDDGTVFSDWPDGEVISTNTADSENATVTVVKPKVEKPAERGWFDIVYRYPIEEYEARDDDGNVYSMKEACNQCGLSLCAHRCNMPSVYGKPVTIVGRKPKS